MRSGGDISCPAELPGIRGELTDAPMPLLATQAVLATHREQHVGQPKASLGDRGPRPGMPEPLAGNPMALAGNPEAMAGERKVLPGCGPGTLSRSPLLLAGTHLHGEPHLPIVRLRHRPSRH